MLKPLEILIYGPPSFPRPSGSITFVDGTRSIETTLRDTPEDFFQKLLSSDPILVLISPSQPDWRDIFSECKAVRTDLPYYLCVPRFGAPNTDYNKFFETIRVVALSDDVDEVLETIIQFALEKREEAHDFRNEKDELVRQLIDIRDAQERIEAQAEHYVEMAEALDYSKQSLEKLNAQKDKLFSVIAHDLKSPFTAILGYTELLSTMAPSLKPGQVQDYAKHAHTAANDVFRLMQTLLEWARVQIGRTDYDVEAFNLAELTEGIAKVYEGIAHQKGLKLQVPPSDLYALTDRGMYETLLRNLVNNAIKFSDAGGTIRVSFQTEGRDVIVSVEDQGIGMSPEQVTAFKGSGELSSTLGTSGESGTGLGLSICCEMLQQNGSYLRVESTLGSGSKFSFSLPIAGPT